MANMSHTARVCLGFHSNVIKTESTRSLSNKWTKTQYEDYLHHIANFCMTVLNIFPKKKSFLYTWYFNLGDFAHQRQENIKHHLNSEKPNFHLLSTR